MAEPAGRGDLAEICARFGAELRRAGLPVGPGRSERFAGAVVLARPQTLDELYRCALATLVSGRDQVDILRAVFNVVFGGLDDPAGPRGTRSTPAPRPPSTPENLLARAARAAKSHVIETVPAPARTPARTAPTRPSRSARSSTATWAAPSSACPPRTSPTCRSLSCCC